MCFISIGAFASQAVRLPGLLLLVSLLAVAIGLEGAVHQRDLAPVLTDAVVMLVVVEAAYFAASLFSAYGGQARQHRKL